MEVSPNIKIDQNNPKDDISIGNDQSTSLSWATNQSLKKITIASNLINQNFSLLAQASNITGGISTGKVPISTFEQDLIIDIDNSEGICDIQFTAIAKKDAQKGQEVHLITYTLTDS